MLRFVINSSIFRHSCSQFRHNDVNSIVNLLFHQPGLTESRIHLISGATCLHIENVFMMSIAVARTVIWVYLLMHIVQSSLWSRLTSARDESSKLIDPYEYGVDVTYPIHHPLNKNSYFGRRYEEVMRGCYKIYSRLECEASERARLDMNLAQPRTQHNYTISGFKKLQVPQDVFKVILDYYEKNIDQDVIEDWARANTYTNYWDSPTTVINLHSRYFRSGQGLMEHIWNGVKPVLEDWVGHRLAQQSVFGIRLYHHGAVLAPHVDKLPSVVSAVIHVAQDVKDPWPLEVYTRDGKAHNITMEPGDMFLYESHTIVHGRPFPMNGKRYADVYVHCIPMDHDAETQQDQAVLRALSEAGHPALIQSQHKNYPSPSNMKPEGRMSMGGHEHDNSYQHVLSQHLHNLLWHEIQLGAATPASSGYDASDTGDTTSDSLTNESNAKTIETAKQHEAISRPPRGRTDLHLAAARGQYEKCLKLLETRPRSILQAKDENGWQAIHEAARGGHYDVVLLLLDHGADIGAVTLSGQTPLWWARRSLYEGHDVIALLEDRNAPEGEGDDLEGDQTFDEEYQHQ